MTGRRVTPPPGPPSHVPPKGEAIPCCVKNDNVNAHVPCLQTTIGLPATVGGPLTGHHLVIIKVILLIINCCLAVRAKAEVDGVVVGVGGRLLKPGFVSTPNTLTQTQGHILPYTRQTEEEPVSKGTPPLKFHTKKDLTHLPLVKVSASSDLRLMGRSLPSDVHGTITFPPLVYLDSLEDGKEEDNHKASSFPLKLMSSLRERLDSEEISGTIRKRLCGYTVENKTKESVSFQIQMTNYRNYGKVVEHSSSGRQRASDASLKQKKKNPILNSNSKSSFFKFPDPELSRSRNEVIGANVWNFHRGKRSRSLWNGNVLRPLLRRYRKWGRDEPGMISDSGERYGGPDRLERSYGIPSRHLNRARRARQHAPEAVTTYGKKTQNIFPSARSPFPYLDTSTNWNSRVDNTNGKRITVSEDSDPQERLLEGQLMNRDSFHKDNSEIKDFKDNRKIKHFKDNWEIRESKDNISYNDKVFDNEGERLSRVSNKLTSNLRYSWNAPGMQREVSDHKEEHLERDFQDKRLSKKHREKRKIEMLEVTVVEGGLAALPCDLKPSDPNDSVQLILWIKEGIHTPLYSYDYRELLGGRPKEMKPDANSTLSRRTTFRTDRSPAALIVERVEAEDGGVYRCRVDFLLSPTVNKRVNLTVIVPPNQLRVSWQLGNSGLMEVNNREAGPFLESTQPSLICFSDDGWPPASISWYESDDLLDDSYSYDPIKAIVQNELNLSVLTRDDLGRRLTCSASNTNKTQPTIITISIAMTLSILSVEVADIGVVWAGESTQVECQVWGSRPQPSVVWWLGPQMIPPTNNRVTDEGNVTISVLNFTPKPRDDGSMLICQATNEKLPDQAVQNSIRLAVNYAPVVEVQLGRSLNPERIKEGDDVYFECTAKSKPPVQSVSWRHNGKELLGEEGILVSNMSLVVQGVSRDDAGDYTCLATNIRNTSSSPPYHLDVKYAPVCANQRKQQYSVAKFENAEISCKVHANPSDVTFRWTFNNTAEAIDVPDGRFVVVRTESRVNYTPMNELDYGTLLCWANNTIGIQQHPCIFHIVAAGKPDPPHNCRVFDVTISSLQVTCLAGDDGGLTQNFLLKVYQIGSTSPVVKVNRSSPSFSVSGLHPATAYKIIIAAINDKGSSRITELKAYTIRVPETQEETSAEPTRDRDMGSGISLAVGIGGSVVALPLILVGIGLMVRLRVCKTFSFSSRGSPSETDGGSKPTSAQTKEAVASTVISTEAPSFVDENNPDIISHTPDPPIWQEDHDVSISTITTSSYHLPNGRSTYSAANPTINPPKSSPARVLEYNQLANTGGTHVHIHDTTCLNTSVHPYHACHVTAAAMPQVPYYTGVQQQQTADRTLAPPSSYSQGYQGAREFPPPTSGASFSTCTATLERKRPHQHNVVQARCPHLENLPLKCLRCDPNREVFFPHLFHQQTTGPPHPSCGMNNVPTHHRSHYSLSHYQEASSTWNTSQTTPSSLVPITTHPSSSSSSSHVQSSHVQCDLPGNVSEKTNVSVQDKTHPKGGSKKWSSGRDVSAFSVSQSASSSPSSQRLSRSGDGGKNRVKMVEEISMDASSTGSPGSSSRSSKRESTV